MNERKNTTKAGPQSNLRDIFGFFEVGSCAVLMRSQCLICSIQQLEHAQFGESDDFPTDELKLKAF